MNKQIKKKKKHFTIIELIVVIVIISFIMATIAYNMQGVLDKGRAFRTREAMTKIDAIVNLTVANNPALGDAIEENWEEIVRKDPLAGNPDAVIYDGWGQKFKVTKENGTIIIQSDAYDAYKRDNPGAL